MFDAGGVAVTAPSNYNPAGLIIKVDPDAIFASATVDIKAAAEAIAAAITAIHSTWENLALGWVGQSATEAQDFTRRWNAAITGLFGTPADPEAGALPKIAKAVAIAAVNFGAAEDSVHQMFSSVSDGLEAPPSGAVTPPARNKTDGPVTEVAVPP